MLRVLVMAETTAASSTKTDVKSLVIAALLAAIVSGVYCFNLGLGFDNRGVVLSPASASTEATTTSTTTSTTAPKGQ